MGFRFNVGRGTSPSARRAAAALAVAAVLAASAPAAANGRYPAAGLIALDPSDPGHILVRATYGVLSTHDGGGAWRWICEGVIGYGGYEDPMIAILADGSVVAGLFKGLSASRNRGCDWAFAGGELTDKYVTDLSAERVDPSRAVLVVSNGVASGQFLTQLWETADNGSTWTKAGVDLPSDFLALTVDTAPSDPQRVYVSGRYGSPDYPGAIERSPDRGQTWERFDIAGSDDMHLPFLSAIDPSDPDILYVRLDGEPTDALLVSTNGGESFTTAFDGQGDLLGFALSPDGATVLVGGPKDGLWRALAATLAFERISDVGVKCLTWGEAGVFACADEFTDQFTVGLSTDEGETFSPLLHLDGLCGPLECAAESGVAAICTELWGATKLTLGSASCGEATGGGGAGAGAAPGDAGGGGGCGCLVAPGAAPAAWTAVALAAAAALLRRAGRRGRGAPSDARGSGSRQARPTPRTPS